MKYVQSISLVVYAKLGKRYCIDVIIHIVLGFECARNLWIIFREAFPNQIGVLCYFLEEGIRARDETYAIHHRLFSSIP